MREPITFDFTVANDGNAPVANVSFIVNISGNGTSMQVNQSNFTTIIEEFGGTATLNFTYTSFTHGTFTFQVRADNVNNFSELNEGNNEINFTTTFFYPDVRISSTDITFNTSVPFVDQSIEITVLVHDDSIFKSYNVSVNLSRSGKTLNTSNVTEIPYSSADSIKFNFTPNQSGTHIFRVQLLDNLTTHEHGNQNNDIATASAFVRGCAPGSCRTNMTVNYPNGGETVSGTIIAKAYAYDEDDTLNGGYVSFYVVTPTNSTYTFIAATNDSTGSHFIVGGDGALYTVNLNTNLFADGNYSLFANSSVTENDTSDQTFTISNAVVGGGGDSGTGTGGGDESGGGRGGGDEIPNPKDFGIGIIPLIPQN